MTAAEALPPDLGRSIKAMVDDWARFSEDGDKLTRTFLSPEHKACAEAVMADMRAVGMTARVDAIGNVVGRYEAAEPGAPLLMTGSHIDTVRDAGAYDGNLGVALPLGCVAALHAQGRRLPFTLEIIAFGDEEGVRFPTTLSGSRALAGTFDSEALAITDAAGTSLGDALRGFGCDPAEIPAAAERDEPVAGFVEIHIEQGPVLESQNLPVGIVTAINGASRFAIRVEGMAGHAGTVPMGLRRDALARAAEMIQAIESRALADEGLVATVGRLEVAPGAINVIPGRVDFTLDVRAPDDALRARAIADIEGSLRGIAETAGLSLALERLHDAAAVGCAPELMDALEAATLRQGIRPLRLPSGAGHDAMAVAARCPVAMLFVRCGGGISHNPLESITAEDAGAAARVFLDFLEHFDPGAAA